MGEPARGEARHSARSRSRAARSAEKALVEAASRYPPLARCLERLDHLRRRQRRRKARRWLAALALRLVEGPLGLLAPARDPVCRTVRFVALSDTHRYHSAVEVPGGEVLLFVGDFVGNYGRQCDLSRHFEQFLSWLSVQSKRFRQVFFTCGNHETLLDEQQGDASLGLAQLRSFLESAPNCRYLANEFASCRGIRLFGSPVTVSRVETEGKRYYSRAFEWPAAKRAALWAEIPEGLDLLVTHCPPSGRLCSAAVGDPVLGQRITSMSVPPRVHVFGHDHCFLGVERGEQTLFLNVAQDEILRLDPRGGGCALMFDMEVRDDEGEGA